MSLFLGFFPLWGYIDPYTNRGAEKHRPFYFHSENQLTDKTDDANLISQKHTAFYHILTFHRPSHLCDALLFAQQTNADYVANPQKGSTYQETKTGTILRG